MSTNRNHSRRFVDSPIRWLMFLLIVQTCFAAMAQAQSPNMTGSWKVEINFAEGNKRALRFDGHFPAAGSNVEPMGARETLGGEVDAWRPKLCDVFGRGGISDRQCRSRSGNVDVQGKIRNGGLDQRRGGIRSACRRATVKARHVQSEPHSIRANRRKRR